MVNLKLDHIVRNQLSREQECEGSGEVIFVADKLRKVVSEMASNKSPGPDGIRLNFIKYFLMTLFGI